MRALALAAVMSCAGPAVAAAQPCADATVSSEQVSIRFANGLATLRLTLGFASGRPGAEGRYVRALPAGARLGALRVCSPHGCRAGRPELAADTYEVALGAPGAPIAPIARATVTVPGHATPEQPLLTLRVAPVAPGLDVTATLTLVVPLAQHAGVSTLVLPPARGATAARTQLVRFAAPHHEGPRIGEGPAGAGPSGVPADRPIAVEATLRPGLRETSAHLVRCGPARCARLRVAAGPAPPAPADFAVALDLAPASGGVVVASLRAAFARLAEALPPGSRLRPMRIGTGAAWLGPLATPDRARDRLPPLSIGSFPFFEDSVEEGIRLLARSGGPRRLVILGDGASVARPDAVVSEARRAGVELSFVDVTGGPMDAEPRRAARESGGLSIVLGAEPAEARRQLLALAAPRVIGDVRVDVGGPPRALGSLRAGEALVWESRAGSDAPTLLIDGAALGAERPARWLDAALGVGMHGRLRGTGGGWDRRGALVAAPTGARRVAAVWAGLKAQGDGPEPPLGSGAGVTGHCPQVPAPAPMAARPAPPESVRRAFAGIRPMVRACFRSARRGRADFSARVLVTVDWSGRTMRGARADGEVSDALRLCVLDAVAHLRLPPSEAPLRVRYPFVAEAAAPAPPAPLAPAIDAAVRDVLEHLPAP